MVDEKRAPRVVAMPELGESVTEGVVSRFLKRPGDPVKRDEPVLEVETDKVVVELVAPESGVIGSIADEAAVIRVGEPVYTILVDGDGRAAPSVAPARAAAPGLRGWQQTWDVRRAQKRASQLTPAGTSRAPVEAALFATALVRALAAVPALLSRAAPGRPAEVTVEHCEVAAGEARWSHVSLRPDESIHGALARRGEGRGPGARVRVIRLGASAIVAATPGPSTEAITIVIGPTIVEAAVEGEAIVARPRATLTLALAQELPADQVQAFAEALAEQLQAV